VTTNRNIRIVLIVVAANFAMFVVARAVAPGILPIALFTALAASAAMYGRSALRPPIVAATIPLIGLTLVELIDIGGLPPIRISM
jgi:hypothetical protein